MEEKEKLREESCEDLVSREAVIKAFKKNTFDSYDGLCLYGNGDISDIRTILEDVPNVLFKTKIADKEKIKDLFAKVLNSFFTMSNRYGISIHDKDYINLNDNLANLQMYLFEDWKDFEDILRKARLM